MTTKAEVARRSKIAHIVTTAAFTAQGYGRPDLAAELHALAGRIGDGTATFDLKAAMMEGR